MEQIQKQMESFRGKQKRTYVFNESGELRFFMQIYCMNIEKCLKAFAMDEECKDGCSEKIIN